MDQVNTLISKLYVSSWESVQDRYDSIEFTRTGLYIYLISFLLLLLPLTIFTLEYLTGSLRQKLSLYRNPPPPPTKIKELRVYPIKSCRGFTVQKTRMLRTGLDLDRNWMFVDAVDYKFLTIRNLSEMTLIDTRISEKDELVVSVRGKEEMGFVIPAHPSRKWLEGNTTLNDGVVIWGQKVDAWVYPEGMTKSFAELFGKEVRLVYKGPTPRALVGNAAPERLGRTESTKFPDLMPVQISNFKSIEELNIRLEAQNESPTPIERFRPNIVVEGLTPWYEDSWKTVRINHGVSRNKSGGGELTRESSVTIDVAARCARCQVPNVDCDTAVKHKKQPWDTLMKYRRIDKGITFKPCFGMLCCPREEGDVAVGDWLEILEVTDQHDYMKGM
ncbi:hypothetical protein EJ08DRAFT_653674 [Tothia fuscella]|uniref:MOSC domain-containing protein n=1 Tax=Tothia fuscella TaxID=1048955 RepID=A0A9P4NH19_9PEZI|nr:hypothetical protein EJ08DRAFT_653674 [Tothia fuscella]